MSASRASAARRENRRDFGTRRRCASWKSVAGGAACWSGGGVGGGGGGNGGVGGVLVRPKVVVVDLPAFGARGSRRVLPP